MYLSSVIGSSINHTHTRVMQPTWHLRAAVFSVQELVVSAAWLAT